METWIYASIEILLKTGLTVFFIFFVMILITRIAGLQTFAKFNSIDFASTITIGSILAAIILNEGQSLLKGAVSLGLVVAFQFFFSYYLRKSKIFQNLFVNRPVLLMENGHILYENLADTNMREEVLIAKLREANVIQLSEVKAVVLESTGDISVLHGSADKELDDILLEGVKS